MIYKNFSPASKLNKRISIFLIIILTFLCPGAFAAPGDETPEATYTGITNTDVVLNNLNYTDVKNTNTWSNEAIYETGAINVMKGYGNRAFGRNDTISKEQAIAIAYRVIGREADAQTAAEALDAAKKQGQKNANPLSMWSDGYLQLASNDGLITTQELADAFNQDQTTLLPTSFHRGAAAQRQDMAYWLAKALKLQPVRNQQKIFNSYADWKDADPAKIPYIEAVLEKNIMNGDGNGRFNPTQPVTREQTAQIVKNAEPLLFPLIKLDKKIGVIEGNDVSKVLGLDGSGETNTFNVRNSDGKLHQIVTQFVTSSPLDPNVNEQSHAALPEQSTDLVVYKDNKIGKSDMLEAGDKIEYIAAPDNTIEFVKVVSNGSDTKYISAQINKVDTGKSSMSITQFSKLNTPYFDPKKDNISFTPGDETENAEYKYGGNLSVIINGEPSDISKLEPNANAILTIKNNIVTEIKVDGFNKNTEEGGILSGIVEDNNPQLGYITLYNQEGTGLDPDSEGQLAATRTYSYGNQNDVEVYKNNKKAGVEDIGVGDTAFIKLDDAGNVASVSAVDNYTVKYGRVISKSPSNLVVEYDDGAQQVLDIDSSIPVMADKKLTGYSTLKDGDRVKLILDETNKFTKIKEITIEGDEHYVTNIYKGIVSYIDDNTNNLVAQNLKVLDKGKWVKTEQKGFTDLKLAEDCNIYLNNEKVDVEKVNNYLKNNEAYIAVEKDYGGDELAALVSFRNENDAEALYDDSIVNAASGPKEFGLNKGFKNVKYNDGTVVVKDDRLVPGSSITDKDVAYVVANRSYDDGQYYAGVVKIGERPGTSFVQIYRARISQINPNKDFTVESYSQLKDLKWEYSNTPKTFNITYDTRIIDKSGVLSQRDFIGLGSNSFINQTVYILADNTDAILVSTAPHGTYNARGEISDITGGSVGDQGTVITEPTGFKLWDAKNYDATSHMWVDSKEMTLSILKNSIILKNNKIAKPSDLKKGDKVRVIKKDDKETGDAYITIVE